MCAEGKLKDAEKQEEKQKQSAAKKLERLIEKVNKYPFCSILCMYVNYLTLFLLADDCFCTSETM